MFANVFILQTIFIKLKYHQQFLKTHHTKICHSRLTPANNVSWWVECLCQINQLREQSENISKSCWKGKLTSPTGFTEAIHFLLPFRAAAQRSLLSPREQKANLAVLKRAGGGEHCICYTACACIFLWGNWVWSQLQLSGTQSIGSPDLSVGQINTCDVCAVWWPNASKDNDNMYEKDSLKETFIVSKIKAFFQVQFAFVF